MVVRTEEIKVLTLEDMESPNIGFIINPLYTFNQQYSFLSVPNQRMFYTIIYFEEEGGRFAIDQSVVQVQKGEALSIVPSSVCTFEINKEAKGWILLFTDAFFTKRYNDNVLHDFSFLKNNAVYKQLENNIDISKLHMMMDSMYDELKLADKDSKTILRSYLNIVLGMLERCSGIRLATPYNKERENRVRAFEQLLEQYYKSERFPSFYAEKLNISSNYLNRICRERRNKSVGELIRGRILMEAERLLYHTFKTVSEISFELGFDSSSYFITFFKKKHGISPEEFRKMQR
ncbi:helix-turn-helix domain-containing protein [Sphingobacterium siyangense]|uniref:helix-turn-helix domain-containing protein n=1 Tax=Sphingobacterium TaxID=28453 RepID=UPI00200F7505|nr:MULTISPECIES: helix-turn-helix domain-containing protein [Sphingobacterium]UQA74150.1 helix-turn-helix domain-containing protein [Sphingobacterium siyangense]